VWILRPSALVLDGEAVCCDSGGTAYSEKLHSQAYNDRSFLYAFNLLELGNPIFRSLRGDSARRTIFLTFTSNGSTKS
jgi:hypothetical protein